MLIIVYISSYEYAYTILSIEILCSKLVYKIIGLLLLCNTFNLTKKTNEKAILLLSFPTRIFNSW